MDRILKEGWEALLWSAGSVDQWYIWAIYLAAMLYIFKYVKNVMMRDYLQISVISIIIICNPATVWIVINYMFYIERYFRFFWMMPVYLVIAMAAAEISSRKGGKTACVLTLLLCMAGTSIFPENYEFPKNAYKVPQEAVAICSYFQNTDEYKQGNLKICADPELSCYIRQVDGRIRLHFGRTPGAYSKSLKREIAFNQLIMEDASQISIEQLTDAMHTDECRYAVIKEGKVNSVQMEQYGYSHINSFMGYEIYKER